MNLVIYDTNPIPELVRIVNQYFSNIPNLNIKPTTYDNSPFNNLLGRIIIYKSEHSLHTLSLVWQTPSYLDSPNNGLNKFIKRFFHGKGSIHKHLEAEGLAIKIYAKEILHSESFWLFQVQIRLTKEGLERLTEVVKVVFDFMQTLISMSEEQFNFQWRTYNDIRQIQFDYYNQVSTIDYAK